MNDSTKSYLYISAIALVLGFVLGMLFKGCITPKPAAPVEQEIQFEGKPTFKDSSSTKVEIKNPQRKTEGVLTNKKEKIENPGNQHPDEFQLPFSFGADTTNKATAQEPEKTWHTAEYTDTTTGLTVYARSLMELPADLILGVKGKLKPSAPVECDKSWLNTFEAGYIAGNLQWLVVAILFFIKVL